MKTLRVCLPLACLSMFEIRSSDSERQEFCLFTQALVLVSQNFLISSAINDLWYLQLVRNLSTANWIGQVGYSALDIQTRPLAAYWASFALKILPLIHLYTGEANSYCPRRPILRKGESSNFKTGWGRRILMPWRAIHKLQGCTKITFPDCVIMEWNNCILGPFTNDVS